MKIRKFVSAILAASMIFGSMAIVHAETKAKINVKVTEYDPTDADSVLVKNFGTTATSGTQGLYLVELSVSNVALTYVAFGESTKLDSVVAGYTITNPDNIVAILPVSPASQPDTGNNVALNTMNFGNTASGFYPTSTAQAVTETGTTEVLVQAAVMIADNSIEVKATPSDDSYLATDVYIGASPQNKQKAYKISNNNLEVDTITLGKSAPTVVDPETVTITPDKANPVAVGDAVTLTAVVGPEGADQTVTWESNNTDVAEVSTSGVVTAKKPGKAIITATAAEGVYKTYEVKVLPKAAVNTGKHWTDGELKTIIWNTATIDGVRFGKNFKVKFEADGAVKDAALDVSSIETEATITFPILLKLSEKASIARESGTAVGNEITATISCDWAE